MGFKKDPNFTYTIEEFVGAIKESTSHDWCKAVLRISWGDNPTSLDIRSVNMRKDEKRIGKGISLSNEEADRLVSILLDNGYGSLEDIEAAIKKRRSIFTVEEKQTDFYDPDEDDGYVHVYANL